MHLTYETLLAFFGQVSQESPQPDLLHAMHHEGVDVGTWEMWTPEDPEAARYFRAVRFHAPAGHPRKAANDRIVTSEEVLAAFHEGRVAGPFPGGGKHAGEPRPRPPLIRWGRFEPEGPTGPLVIVYQYCEFAA
jgi:hypothetical protein